MKTNIIKYGLIGIILVLSIFSINQCTSRKKAEKVVKDYKEVLLEKDSLRKNEQGIYQKLVNDNNTKKNLIRDIKKENKDLSDLLKKERKKPISSTTLTLQPDSKIDTITITKVERDGNFFKRFTDFYPDKNKPFIIYEGTINNDSLIGKWDLKEFKIVMVISEKSKGLYEMDSKVPSWLSITGIKINSLPLENIKPDNFDWLLGCSLNYDYGAMKPIIGLETGIRLKKTIFSISGYTNNTIGINYKQLF